MSERSCLLKSTIAVLKFLFFFSSDGINDPDHVGDYVSAWRAMLPQRATLICLKADSDEIVGMNVNYILTKSDTIAEDINKTVSVSFKRENPCSAVITF